MPVPDQERDERRLKKRYPVWAHARYRWQDGNGTWFSESGMTLNISVAGIYILTSSSPPPGAQVEMRVAVSTTNLDTGRGCLFGKGVVTRVNSETGFAAQINLRMLRARRSDAKFPDLRP